MNSKDRRRFHRIRPAQPLAASVGVSRVYVLDGSIGGVALLHENVLPALGEMCRLQVQSEIGPMTLDCEVVRTAQQPMHNGLTKPLFQSGLRVVSADHQSARRLRETFGAVASQREH
jgi:hypothetical protein